MDIKYYPLRTNLEVAFLFDKEGVEYTSLERDNHEVLRVVLQPSQIKRLAELDVETWVFSFQTNLEETQTKLKATPPLTLLILSNVMTPSDKDIQFFSENPHLPRVYWEWQTNHSVSHISNHQLTVRIFVRYVFRGEELAG
jgi:hypothetical protein